MLQIFQTKNLHPPEGRVRLVARETRSIHALRNLGELPVRKRNEDMTALMLMEPAHLGPNQGELLLTRFPRVTAQKMSDVWRHREVPPA